MAITKTIGRRGETRIIEFSGNVGSKFEMYVKESANYYNWDTDSFQTTEKILKNQEIPSSGIYTKSIIIPTVIADTSYDFYIRPLPGTVSKLDATNSQKIGVLYQKGGKTMTFNATESSALVVQNSGSAGSDLTGGTLNSISSTLTQVGTITEASGLFVYIHETPTWNRNDGGNWTNANTVEFIVASVSGAVVTLVDAEGEVADLSDISTGYTVTGASIIDEVTVSAISANKATLSAEQKLKLGEQLTFSKGGWIVDSIAAEFTAGFSGTVTITMKTTHRVSSIGIADVTSVLNVDAFASVKPNAFPIPYINCAAGGEVVIYPIVKCVNYLGQSGDNDANVGSKTYKVHSVPAAGSTASRPTGGDDDDGNPIYATLTGIAGSIDVSAGAAMGSAGAAEVTYTPSGEMIAGDKDYFYYKTVDGQSTPVTSSTTQGKIEITIV